MESYAYEVGYGPAETRAATQARCNLDAKWMEFESSVVAALTH